jgi:hypothetical protein
MRVWDRTCGACNPEAEALAGELRSALHTCWTQNATHRSYVKHAFQELETVIERAAAFLRRSPGGAERDAERLEWLEAQATPRMKWCARPSTTGRGFRLHQDPMIGTHATAREAIDAALARNPEGQ